MFTDGPGDERDTASSEASWETGSELRPLPPTECTTQAPALFPQIWSPGGPRLRIKGPDPNSSLRLLGTLLEILESRI